MALERPLHQRAPRRRLPLLLLPAVRPPGGAASSAADRRLSSGPHLRRNRPRARRRPALPPRAAGGAPPSRPPARRPGSGCRLSGPGAGQPVRPGQPGGGTRPPPSGDQRLLLAPGPVSLTVSLGLPLLAAVAGMVIAWRRRDRGLALLFVWPPLVLALLYLPNIANIQRRLLDALYVPIGILAAVGIRSLTSRLRRARARRIEAILVTSCCLSSLIVLAIALRFASGAFAEAYIADDSWRAMQSIATHHQPGDRALSSPGAGQRLPAWAGVSVYVGHYSETLDYFQKIRNVSEVLKPGASEATVRAFLHDNGITLLYWGPDETLTGFQPASQPYLEPVHQDGAVTIYRVLP